MCMLRGVVVTAGVLTVSLSGFAQVEGPANVRVIVRADAKHDAVPPTLSPATVKVEVDGHTVPVLRVQPLLRQTNAPVEVAVLMDDGLRGNFGLQLAEVEQFVRNATAAGVSVGLGYMRNGTADFPAGFSTDAERELQALRLPIASAGVSGSPYFCLQSLVKNWPTNTAAPHVVLMITNGIDYYNGSVSPLNQNSPYVQAAQDDAQRANVPVYSIYYGGRNFNSNLGSFSGQGYLQQVGDATGGKLFNTGQINPPSIAPYFQQFTSALRESYLLGIPVGGKHLERLKVSTTVSGLKLKTQNSVQAPRSE